MVFFYLILLNIQLKDMDDVDMLTLVIQEMSKEFPTLMETLVHERDQLVFFLLTILITLFCFCLFLPLFLLSKMKLL